MNVREIAYSLTPNPYRTEATAIDLVQTQGLLKSLCASCQQHLVDHVTGRPRIYLNPKAVWEYMDRNNLSQNDLARQLNVTSGYLSLLMNGQRHPSPALRRRLLSTIKAPHLFIRR